MNDTIIGNAIPGWNTLSANIKMTPEGGLAVKVINDTGAASIKGTVVHASPAVDRGVSLNPLDNPDPCGIVYDEGIPNGEFTWIVQGGMAEVLYSTPVVRSTFSRASSTLDAAPVVGEAINEPLPAPPFATNKHFLEIGHPAEARATPGLALTYIHFL